MKEEEKHKKNINILMLFYGLQTGEMNKRVVVIEKKHEIFLLKKIEIAHLST